MLHNPIIAQVVSPYLSNVSLSNLKATNREIRNLYPNATTNIIKLFSQEMFDATSSKSLIDYIEPPKKIDTMKHIIAENSPKLIQYCYDKGYPINEDIIEEAIYKKYKNSFLWLKHNNFIIHEENYLLALQKGLYEQNSNPQITGLNYLYYINSLDYKRRKYYNLWMEITNRNYYNNYLRELYNFTSCWHSHQNPFILHSIIDSQELSSEIRRFYSSEQHNIVLCQRCGLTDLHYSAMYSSVNLLQKLVFESNSIQYYDNYSRTLLHMSVKYDNLETTKWLLDNGATQTLDYFYMEPIDYAIQNENIESIDILLEDKYKKEENVDMFTLLHDTIRLGNAHIVKHLLEFDNRPIHRDYDNENTLLFYSILLGYPEIVKTFLDYGASQERYQDEKNPLYYAILLGNIDIVTILIEYGGLQINDNGTNSLRWAILLNQPKIVKILMKFGVKQERNERGESPLHIASRKGYSDIIQTLIRYGADIDQENEIGDTPLQNVARIGYVKILKILLEHGADINQEDDLGDTPLHQTVKENNSLCTEVLLQNGAKQKENELDESPLDFAMKYKNYEISKILIEYM